jgi:hypothetical protein
MGESGSGRCDDRPHPGSHPRAAAALSVAVGRGPIGQVRVRPMLAVEEINKAAETQRARKEMPEISTTDHRRQAGRVAGKRCRGLLRRPKR